MSPTVIAIVCIVALLLVLAIVRELFRIVARGIIKGVGKILKGFFSALWFIVSGIGRILLAPFSLLWGFITSR